MKQLILVFILNILCVIINAQHFSAHKSLSDKDISLKEGIYFSKDEFLNNEPTVTYRFEIIDNESPYIFFPEENNAYYITYLDIVGQRVVLPMMDIWGFYDGKGIFVSFNGKPFQIVSLGAISLISYYKEFRRNQAAHVITLYTFGISTESVHKREYALLDLEKGRAISLNRKNFEDLIERDPVVFEEYSKDKTWQFSKKWPTYFSLYNIQNQLSFKNNQIKLNQTQD